MTYNSQHFYAIWIAILDELEYGVAVVFQELSKVATMLKGKYKNFLVAILLLTYVGQGFAAANMTCKNMTSKSAHFEQSEKSGACAAHSKHLSSDTGKSTNSSDCCQQCYCYIGGCSTTALPVAPQSVAQIRSSVPVDGYVDSTLSQFALSLFRPPIAC